MPENKEIFKCKNNLTNKKQEEKNKKSEIFARQPDSYNH